MPYISPVLCCTTTLHITCATVVDTTGCLWHTTLPQLSVRVRCNTLHHHIRYRTRACERASPLHNIMHTQMATTHHGEQQHHTQDFQPGVATPSMAVCAHNHVCAHSHAGTYMQTCVCVHVCVDLCRARVWPHTNRLTAAPTHARKHVCARTPTTTLLGTHASTRARAHLCATVCARANAVPVVARTCPSMRAHTAVHACVRTRVC